MFTGIIKAVGTVERIEPGSRESRLQIAAEDLPWGEYSVGDSIAVNGVCLTAVELNDGGFASDVSSETLGVTAMRHLAAGSRVNLEPALRLGDPLGGHLVSGHVDCVGSVLDCSPDGSSLRLGIRIPAGFAKYTVPKGSVCVDGVSLTINEVSADAFWVNIIPHTANATIAGDYAAGRQVNIEIDMVARYLEGLLGESADEPANNKPGRPTGITKNFLRAHGYA